MAARAIGDDEADYSFLIKQCSSQINCCSVRVWFAAIHATTNGRHPAAGVKGITVERSSNRVGRRTLASTHVGDRHLRRHGRLGTAGAAEMPGPPMCIAVPAVVTGGAAPLHADGTDNAPALVA
jgi:hypothetical protein